MVKGRTCKVRAEGRAGCEGMLCAEGGHEMLGELGAVLSGGRMECRRDVVVRGEGKNVKEQTGATLCGTSEAPGRGLVFVFRAVRRH